MGGLAGVVPPSDLHSAYAESDALQGRDITLPCPNWPAGQHPVIFAHGAEPLIGLEESLQPSPELTPGSALGLVLEEVLDRGQEQPFQGRPVRSSEVAVEKKLVSLPRIVSIFPVEHVGE
jgi:hypothetical protein